MAVPDPLSNGPDHGNLLRTHLKLHQAPLLSSALPGGEQYLYVFKGARSAPCGPCPPILGKHRASALTPSAAQLQARNQVSLNRGTVTRRAPLAALRPCRATAASARTFVPAADRPG